MAIKNWILEETEGPCNDMVTLPPTEAHTPQAADTGLFNIPIPLIEAGRAKPTDIPLAPDTVSSWLEKLSDDERDTYQERAEIEAIKRIIQERIIRGKCDICQRVAGCMLTPGQRTLCQVVG